MSRREPVSRTVDVLQVDVFTAAPFGGNPAGVVLDGGALTEDELRRVAAELNAPATAFLAPPAGPGASPRLRWFTATGTELTFCGHGTIATAHALAEAGRLPGGGSVFETVRGPIAVTVEPAPLVWIEPALPTVAPDEAPLGPIFDALGLSRERVAAWARPARTSEGDLLVPVTGLDVLKALAPDLGRLGRLATERRLRGVALTARETVEAASLTHTRFFAPGVGIPEDSTTGSVHAAIPVWLWAAGLLTPVEGVARFQAEQGDFLGRPGRLAVELHVAAGQPARVRVGGRAVTVLTGTLRLS